MSRMQVFRLRIGSLPDGGVQEFIEIRNEPPPAINSILPRVKVNFVNFGILLPNGGFGDSGVEYQGRSSRRFLLFVDFDRNRFQFTGKLKRRFVGMADRSVCIASNHKSVSGDGAVLASRFEVFEFGHLVTVDDQRNSSDELSGHQ